MKKTLLLLFVVFSLSAFGQTYQYMGAPGTTVVNKGSFRVDSFLYLPNALPVSSILRSGALRYNTVDSSLAVWTGTQWLSTNLSTSVASAYVKNQYASQQVANAWFDSLKLHTLRMSSKITGTLANVSYIRIPYTEQNTRTNGVIHLGNLAEGDSRSPFTSWESSGVISNQYGGSHLRMSRFLFEADGDTANSIDYAPVSYLYSRYTMSPTIGTYDSATGKLFYPKDPGYTATVQYYPNGRNIRLATSQFGHMGAAYVGTLALFDSIGTINTIGATTTRPVPMTPFFSDIDMNRAATGGEKKVFRGQVGIANYFASWKFHQSATGATTGIGNYWNKVAGFQAGGSTNIGLDKTTLGWAVDKAAILTYSTVDTSMGFWSMEQYNDSNEVKNGYGFVQSGVKDINAFLGKTYIGSWPLKASADTTTAKLVVKAKMWADSLAVGVISGNAYITGALSVGTTSTTYKAQIVNSAALGLKVTTSIPSTGNPGFAIRDNNTAQEAFFTPSNSNHLAIGNYTNHPIQFYQNNSSIATLNSTSLKVNSGRLNLTASTPPTGTADASGTDGDLIVGTDGHLYYKLAGTGWVKFAGVTF